MENKQLINWFEIPTINIQRAQNFYEHIFECKLIALSVPHEMRFFPLTGNFTGGALAHKESFYKPSPDGVLIYLNANPDMQAVLDKVAATGGEILVQRTKISDEHGYISIIKDTEGKRIGLQSLH